MHAAYYRDVSVVFDDGAQLGFVTAATELIQYDTGDVYPGVEGLVTQD